MNHRLYHYLVKSQADAPSGMLAQFSLARLVDWPTLVGLLAGAVLYVYAAQQWLLMAFQLWLGYAAATVALALLNRWHGARAEIRLAVGALVLGSALGAFAGSLIWFQVIGMGTFRWSFLMPHWWPALAFGMLSCGTLMVRDFVRSERAIAVRAQLAMERQRQESAKQAAEAQLRLLQAQIEPHFLLNTLANVRSLIKRDGDRARDMLDHLCDYLHVALPRMRQTNSTLEREVALSASYLSIMQIRMGDRLRYRVHLGEDTAGLTFPPMLLQTLVENAVKHGLEPSADPGEILISAELIASPGGDCLRVCVADTGIGFGRANTSGTGIGLINIRERLHSLYGTDASLEISPNMPTGVVATLSIPAALNTTTKKEVEQ
ncbi:MAG: sensor histidine kinase [Burkholderiales bacterium]|jgi:signal transduction histidine kinase|nr:histidine kinase [Betaproteobacteria bacterium]